MLLQPKDSSSHRCPSSKEDTVWRNVPSHHTGSIWYLKYPSSSFTTLVAPLMQGPHFLPPPSWSSNHFYCCPQVDTWVSLFASLLAEELPTFTPSPKSSLCPRGSRKKLGNPQTLSWGPISSSLWPVAPTTAKWSWFSWSLDRNGSICSPFCILVVRIFSSRNIFCCSEDPSYNVAKHPTSP